MERILRWKFVGVEDMVGLPEYRNGFRSASISRDPSSLISFTLGGLLVDFGVLTLKPGALPVHPESGIPRVPPSHPAIVEWRAMTVIELYAIHLFLSPLIEAFFFPSTSDRIADAIRRLLGVSAAQLTLAHVLESATWKGGREIARQKRPETSGPPIDIESDGTVF